MLFKPSSKLIKFIIVAVGLVLLLDLGITFVLDAMSNKDALKQECNLMEQFIQENQAAMETALTTHFDQAVRCDSETCGKQVVQTIFNSFQGSETLHFFPSSYLIRLNADGNIEKLFWMGYVKTTIPETTKEKQVVKVLMGHTSALCTQGWNFDQANTSMVYLNDFFSEAELIVPIISQDNQVMGALVSRWGD